MSAGLGNTGGHVGVQGWVRIVILVTITTQ